MGGSEEVRGLMPTLEEALEEAERLAVKTSTTPNLEQVLEIAASESSHPSVAAVWRDTSEFSTHGDALLPSSRVDSLMIEDTVTPQAVGHALVKAAHGGYVKCVRCLREIQKEKLTRSILVGRFNAFAFLKAAENGHQEVIRELLRPMMSASTAMMGYVIATRWKVKEPSSYPFVKPPVNVPGKDWNGKLASTKSMLPAATPIFCPGGWDLRGLPGVPEELHDCIRATYSIYLLWQAAVISAAHCHVEVFKVLLRQRALENTMLADSFHDTSGPKKGFDQDGKKIISDRAKMDTLMYQLVEELSTKNYHDGILYALWGHIQRGGRDSPRPEAGRPRCLAKATNGLWEMQLEVPLLMMPVEHALPDEEPFRRYKQLTQLFSQRAKVNIQLTAIVEALPNCLQVVVGIKHVRFKVENSRWDPECMGHFPCLVTLSVTPVTKEGTGVTMTNSSSNIIVKIGKMERVQIGTNAGDGSTRGISGGMGASATVGVTSTMKNKPWRFEQLPLKDERGGSFVWTLQSMKGVMFDRTNPMRMAERNSKWRFGRRMPSNPLDELPFTSEGGVIFTNAEFDDTMMWRFPKHMDGKKMRWSIEGQIHSTYTTTRYFETRMATFCGDIEEPLKPLEVKDKNATKKGGDENVEKVEKSPKNEEQPAKAEKTPKPESSSKPESSRITPLDYTEAEYLEFLEFKKFKQRMQRQSLGSIEALNYSEKESIPRGHSLGSNEELDGRLKTDKDIVGFVVPQRDILGSQVAIEIMQRKQDPERHHHDERHQRTSRPLDEDRFHSSLSPAGSGNGPGLHGSSEEDSGNRGELWKRRIAASRASDDVDSSIFTEDEGISSSESSNNNGRRITGLSVRTRSDKLSIPGR
ncbi:uncharacterized protein [Physcomitrium patens]|uniref:Uncharacterized protein n=1 Tax=Physcomitrium patens TaxID=3218 RepID=A0A2K1KMF4_PHYPA|nr:uncharacterized protein LOC112281229 [Physcomitrium patens]PNR54947.1 hypothetical protein PHYPA_005840 [Physcomitrium patens]|eukprot:XP_024373279.1 uncharacterized protein LOC112281229 [Physcomitrella patens]